MSEHDVTYEARDGVAWLTIDRPEKRNALRFKTVDELAAGLERAAANDAVRVVVITGAGEKSFCAGADLTAGEGTPQEATRRYAELLKAMDGCPTPLVARVAGHCMGGGLGLLLSCDLAYAADDVKLGTPEVNVGLFPMMVAALLLRAGDRKKLLEMVYTGGRVTAPEAVDLGLLTRALPRAELDATVDEIATTIGSKAPLGLALGRRALAAVESQSLVESFDHLCGELDKLIASEDALEGMTAFMQKRPPVWKGR